MDSSITTNQYKERNNDIVHEGKRNYKCESCVKCFTQSGDLKIHINTIHKGQKNYKCGSCGKYFTQSSSLNLHIRTIHEGQTNFKCDSCGKSFTQSVTQDTHQHNSQGTKKLQMWFLWKIFHSIK